MRVLAVVLHVGREGDEDDEATGLAGLRGVERREEIDRRVAGGAGEDGRTVVLLLHALVVEGEGPVREGLLVEEVVQAVVTGVVNHGGDEDGEDGGGGKEAAGVAAGEEVVRGLEHICCVCRVVVRDELIVLLDKGQPSSEYCPVKTQRFDQPPLVEKMPAEGLQRPTFAGCVQSPGIPSPALHVA